MGGRARPSEDISKTTENSSVSHSLHLIISIPRVLSCFEHHVPPIACDIIFFLVRKTRQNAFENSRDLMVHSLCSRPEKIFSNSFFDGLSRGDDSGVTNANGMWQVIAIM